MVTDLSTDERFKNLPFVTGPPFFRFYAGTPLTTKRGINIGSLFVIDDRVRPELTATQVDFLGTVATIVMRNMELNHEAEERMRSLKMSGALNAFQEGRTTIRIATPLEEARTYGDQELRRNRKKAASSTASLHDMIGEANGSTSMHSTVLSSPADDLDLESPRSANEMTPSEPDQDSKLTFVRAASLLRQSLDLQDTGGVVFLETSVDFHGRKANNPSRGEAEKKHNNGLDTMSPMSDSFKHRTFSRKEDQASDVIGFSTAECRLGSQPNMKDVRSFSPLDHGTLQNLLQSYPRGRLWSFDDDGLLSAWDEDLLDGYSHLSSSETAKMRSQRKQNEATQLSRHFPNGETLCY